MEVVFIVNPAAGCGRTGRIWPGLESRLKRELHRPFHTVFSRNQGHAWDLAANAVREGAHRVVGVGGDGTLNEVLNGFFEGGGREAVGAAVGIFSVGTCGDFAKTLGGADNPNSLIHAINQGLTKRIDVGKADFIDFSGRSATRFFLNVTDFGAGGAVVERVTRTTKRMGGGLAFLWAILMTLFTYRTREITLRIDGEKEEKRLLFDVILGNGRYYGGGIKAAPHAELNSGSLSMIEIGSFGLVEALRYLPAFRAGTYLHHPRVRYSEIRCLEARSSAKAFIEMDGEAVGELPARFELLPGALSMIG